MSGRLVIVPTPVGNLEDMTPRSVKALQDADVILAEDTRTSAVVMRHFGIDTPMVSHHKYNEHETLEAVMRRLEEGQTVALVSDAGTPGISDPGFMLSRECRRRGYTVETLPGATAFVPALVSSGLPCDRFVFEGFLPPKKGRATRLKEIAAEPRTTIIYESPVRLIGTLADLIEVCGSERPAAVCREISKLHETIHRGTLQELHEQFTSQAPRGEIVIVLQGHGVDAPPRQHRSKYSPDNTSNT